MLEKYDLNKLLKEIAEDEKATKGKKDVSQDEIKKMLLEKKVKKAKQGDTL